MMMASAIQAAMGDAIVTTLSSGRSLDSHCALPMHVDGAQWNLMPAKSEGASVSFGHRRCRHGNLRLSSLALNADSRHRRWWRGGERVRCGGGSRWAAKSSSEENGMEAAMVEMAEEAGFELLLGTSTRSLDEDLTTSLGIESARGTEEATVAGVMERGEGQTWRREGSVRGEGVQAAGWEGLQVGDDSFTELAAHNSEELGFDEELGSRLDTGESSSSSSSSISSWGQQSAADGMWDGSSSGSEWDESTGSVGGGGEWSEEAEEEWGVSEEMRTERCDWSNDEDMNRRFRLRNGREIFEERAYLVGMEIKSSEARSDSSSSASFDIKDSLLELSQLADTAGLRVVGSNYQRLVSPNPRTYIGAGKVAEVKAAIQAFGVETVVFDDELSPGQLRNLEKEFGSSVRVCDRTALILDIFNQRAATKEASLQVLLAMMQYQLPRLTRMWSHLERQAGGMVKGMGEKQIEVDKRLLRGRMADLRRQLDEVRDHRLKHREKRAAVPIPVISLVGYTNAGKSSLLNRLSGASVLAEDKLFATLDPTTRRVTLPNGKECLVTDTVGFIQRLPTQLVAAFRATLEEISDASILLHVVDISHPMAWQQMQAVESVLSDLDVTNIAVLTVWNKIDKVSDSESIRKLAAERGDTVCVSVATGEGMDEFFLNVERMVQGLLVPIDALIPYKNGDDVNLIYRVGTVHDEVHLAEGTLIKAFVPFRIAQRMMSYRRLAAALLHGDSLQIS